MYEELKASVFDSLVDLGEYSVKYITSGGYPVFEFKDNTVVTKMLTVAGMTTNGSSTVGRGDCVALIDHTNNPYRSLDPSDATSVYGVVNGTASSVFSSLGDFGAMFTPWCSCTTTYGEQILPASYVYLYALGKSIQSNGNWLS